MNTTTVLIILSGAFASYCLRIGGHFVLSRFDRIHPRVEAGLNAVPAAVLTTLVAPAAFDSTPAQLLALAVCAAVAWRFSLLTAFVAGMAVFYAGRFALGG